jgi:iron complex transport system permease protein
MTDQLTPSRLIIKIALCLALLVVVMFVCSLVGTQKVSLNAVLAGPGTQPGQNIDYDIFVRVRIPRVILAALVGAALAASGVVLQAILRNPLAEPYILGISSGAALGVITAVMLGLSWRFLGGSPLAIMAFVFALGTVWLVWLIGHLAGGSGITSLLLAGVVVNAFFSAVIMLLTSIVDSQQLRSTIFWLMGNITEKDFPTLFLSAIFIIAGIAGLFAICQKLNVLTFGRQEAHSLGVNPRAITLVAFALASFITAVAVGLSGLVGFVGLVVPHSVRLVFGPDHRQLLPTSALVGAAFVVVCDTVARTIIAPAQLPVGVITAIIGGPVFLLLLARYSKKVGSLR